MAKWMVYRTTTEMQIVESDLEHDAIGIAREHPNRWEESDRDYFTEIYKEEDE